MAPWKIVVIVLFAIALWPVTLIALFLFGCFKLYEYSYYHSDRFLSIKHRISNYIRECNALNEHIEGLKHTQLGIDKTRYGVSEYRDNSRWNFKRTELKKIAPNSNVHTCSQSVCDGSRREPMKYVCKYFGFSADEQTLEKFETMLNDFEAVEDGKAALVAQKNEILNRIDSWIPTLIKKFGQKRLARELGFEDIDLSNAHYPSFVFQYVSPGGNASMQNVITMDIDNLNAMVRYLSDRIRWKKSVAGQRALMTSSLRRSILERDGYRCRYCGVGTSDEPHLLLEVDHIVPVSKGGLTSVDNLQTLCWRCNRSKGARMM